MDTCLYGRDSETFYSLMYQAIKRGSPHAIASVGNIIACRNKMEHLYPTGKQLLACAAGQNFADAYNGQRLKACQYGKQG